MHLLATFCFQLICHRVVSVSGRSSPALLPEHLSLILLLVQPPKWRVSLQQGVLLFSGTKIMSGLFFFFNPTPSFSNNGNGLGFFSFSYLVKT